MKADFYYENNFLSKKECEFIKNSTKNLLYEFGKIYSREQKEDINDFNIIRNTIKELHKEQYSDLYNKLWLFVTNANKEYFNFNIQNMQTLRFTEYNFMYKGYFNKHTDMNWVTNENFHRKLTCVVQLTDPSEYDNCDLILENMKENEREEIRKQGTAIVFPSFTTHQVTPITKGVRNSLVLWITGPKFT